MPNQIAKILKGCAWAVWILGLILGILMGTASNALKEMMGMEPSFEFGTALAYWAVAFMGGIMMYFFGELLQKVDDLEFDSRKQKETLDRMDQNLQVIANLMTQYAEAKGENSMPSKQMEALEMGAKERRSEKAGTKNAVPMSKQPPKNTEENVKSVRKKDIMTGDKYLICPFCGTEQLAINHACIKCKTKFTE